MEEKLIEHLKDVQRRLQTEKGYSEVSGNNDLVEYYKEHFAENYDKAIKELKEEFRHVVLTFNSISSHSQHGHWRSVLSTQIGWFLTRNSSIMPLPEPPIKQ